MNKFIKWLVAIYVVAVLAWSGLLKAEEIVLDRVHFDSQYFELTIGGKVTNTCSLSLKTKIIENQFTEELPIAVLELATQNTGENCRLKNQVKVFEMILDIRSLGLPGGTSYQLTFGNSFDDSINPIYSVEIPRESFLPKLNPVFTQGTLTKTLLGQWLVVRGMNDFTILKTKLDLSNYVGQYVSVEGIDILHRTGPVFEVDEHTPLRDHNSNVEGPTMFLNSISTVTF